jgi:hypothetical protein
MGVNLTAARVISATLLAAAFAACSSTDTIYVVKDSGTPPPSPTKTDATTVASLVDSTGNSTQSVEWVSFHQVIPFQSSAFHALASGLFGTDAQNGKYISSQQMAPGVYLSSAADPSTPEQSRVSLVFDDGTSTMRTLALVPASFATGSLFVSTIDAAIATMVSEEAASPGSSSQYLIQYEVSSPHGGTFSFGVQGNMGVFSLVLDVSSPTTNLALGQIGTPANNDTPYDFIAGTVYFQSSQADFDYFVQHAYGSAASIGQNFDNFQLVPHNWLRLTVEPHLADKYVNVGFKVAMLDGTLVPVAQAPASILAGATFQTLADYNMTTMTKQEAAKPGSSFPFAVPFYYNDPEGGGVVSVLITGAQGIFTIDYGIQSPRHMLKEVPFNAYKPVSIALPDGSATAACNQLGNPGIVLAPEGAFDITFAVSSVVVSEAASLNLPLVGDIYCAVYKASDVTANGPNPGSNPVGNFVVPNASFQPGAPTPHYLTGTYPDGSYQVLCSQDITHYGGAGFNNPVTIPITGTPLACNLNPIKVEFAILDPQANTPPDAGSSH